MFRIYLVGFMGAGKTSVGRALARRLDRPFIDLDGRWEDSFGMPIHEIFRSWGEEAFRKAEREGLESIGGLEGAVVATGGGAFCDPLNRDIIHSNGGCSIFLDVPWKVLARRLEDDHAERPKFTGPEAAEALYLERRPHYQAATWTVGLTGSESPEGVAEQVVGLVRRAPCAT